MATTTCKEGIDIAATAAVVYDLIIERLTVTKDDADSMQKRRPLVEGPPRVGFRWEQTTIHNRHKCRTEWVTTRAERAIVLEENLAHFCAERQIEFTGGERWELSEVKGLTHLTLTTWQVRSGLEGFLVKWFMNRSVRKLDVHRRLAYSQFEAERRTLASSEESTATEPVPPLWSNNSQMRLRD